MTRSPSVIDEVTPIPFPDKPHRCLVIIDDFGAFSPASSTVTVSTRIKDGNLSFSVRCIHIYFRSIFVHPLAFRLMDVTDDIDKFIGMGKSPGL